MWRSLLISLSLVFLFAGCEKDAGEGGRAEIHGRVMAQNYPNITGSLPYGDPYPFPEHRVYIIYGDGEFHDDDVRTGHDGRFRFSGLRKGSYTVYTVSERARSASEPSGFEIVQVTIEITEKDEVTDLGDLNVARYRSWN